MTIASLITEVIALITHPTLAPFLGLAIVVVGAARLYQRLANLTLE